MAHEVRQGLGMFLADVEKELGRAEEKILLSIVIMKAMLHS